MKILPRTYTCTELFSNGFHASKLPAILSDLIAADVFRCVILIVVKLDVVSEYCAQLLGPLYGSISAFGKYENEFPCLTSGDAVSARIRGLHW